MGSPLQFRACSSSCNKFPSNPRPVTDRIKSAYHESCIPKDVRERVKSAPPRIRQPREYFLCNHVAEEKIWTERVVKERSMQNNWHDQYGFMLEMDQTGNPRQKKEIDHGNTSVFPKKLPSSVNKEFGYRVQSAPALRMQRLERSLHRGKRRNSDLIYCE